MLILVLSFLTLFALAPSQTPHAHASTKADRETVLKACAVEFGPAIDGQNNLFEVSRHYLLEAKFDDSGRLMQLGVLPKHWFADQHPEWNETSDVGELTWAEYSKLLWRLEDIQSKGNLVRRAKWPVVKGTTVTRRDTYARAILATSDVVDSERPRNAPRTIKSFVLYFTTTK
jgi:hypothetical protein